MGKYFALTLDLGNQTQTKTKSKNIPKVSLNFGFWLAVLLSILGIIYLLSVNSSSTKGYEIKKLESLLLELLESNKRLELEAASLKTIQSIESTVKTLNLVPQIQLRYLGQDQGYALKN